MALFTVVYSNPDRLPHEIEAESIVFKPEDGAVYLMREGGTEIAALLNMRHIASVRKAD